jgi:uncharacterized protein YaiE (UPF0345 family)
MLQSNEYYDGNVKSIAFQGANKPATVGVIAPGDYEFGTNEKEEMVVVSGSMTVTLAGETESVTYSANETFHVPANSSFAVTTTVDTAYLCFYG